MRPPQHALRSRPVDARRVFCAMCEHTEFVHGDVDARRCLYSECACDGFTAVPQLGSIASFG